MIRWADSFGSPGHHIGALFAVFNRCSDIHPPLGKLTISLYAHLRGYKAGICSYESNTMYGPHCQYWIPVSWRACSQCWCGLVVMSSLAEAHDPSLWSPLHSFSLRVTLCGHPFTALDLVVCS